MCVTIKKQCPLSLHISKRFSTIFKLQSKDPRVSYLTNCCKPPPPPQSYLFGYTWCVVPRGPGRASVGDVRSGMSWSNTMTWAPPIHNDLEFYLNTQSRRVIRVAHAAECDEPNWFQWHDALAYKYRNLHSGKKRIKPRSMITREVT